MGPSGTLDFTCARQEQGLSAVTVVVLACFAPVLNAKGGSARDGLSRSAAPRTTG